MRYLLLLVCLWMTIPGYTQVIVISKDTLITGTWNIPPGTVLRFEGGRLKGRGKVNGGVIQAGLRQWIFDTSLQINPEGLYGHDFSAAWFGASAKNNDNYNQIQAGINTCLRNGQVLRNLFIPSGVYNFSKPLLISTIYKDSYVGCTLRLYGEGNFWDSNEGTALRYTASEGFALGIQVGKGVEIDHLKITGTFRSPEPVDSVYYKIPFEHFKDVNDRCVDKQYGPYAGIVIDPFNKGRRPPDGGYNSLSNYYLPGSPNINGSTGIKVHEVAVSNFVVNICISPNGLTRNAEILLFENIRLGDGKVGFSGGEDQEKYNVVKGVYSWGRLHTLFVTGKYGNGTPGNWYIDGGNIAGKPIRLIDNQQSAWYPTHISNVFCESLGTIGTIYSAMPVSISNSTFHFAFPKNVGQLILLDARGEYIKFDNCLFRYYNGGTEPMTIAGNPIFENCLFSGTVKSSGGTPTFINSKAGSVKLGSH